MWRVFGAIFDSLTQLSLHDHSLDEHVNYHWRNDLRVFADYDTDIDTSDHDDTVYVCITEMLILCIIRKRGSC